MPQIPNPLSQNTTKPSQDNHNDDYPYQIEHIVEDRAWRPVFNSEDERDIRMILWQCRCEWNHRFGVVWELSQPAGDGVVEDIIGVLTQLMEYMVRYLFSSDWKQRAEQQRHILKSRVQLIFTIVHSSNKKLQIPDITTTILRTLNNLKLFANQLYLQNIQKQSIFLSQLLLSPKQSLELVVKSKLTFLEQDEKQLSVYSSQSFSNVHTTKQLDLRKLAHMLSDTKIYEMKTRIQTIRCENIRNTCLQSLMATFPVVSKNSRIG